MRQGGGPQGLPPAGSRHEGPAGGQRGKNMITREQKEWKVRALGYILEAVRYEKSGGRLEREWAEYIKRFFFGEGGRWHDLECEAWKEKSEFRKLPLSFTQWYTT